MRIDRWAIAATMASLLPCVSAGAVTEANFTLGSTGDLVALCSAAPDNGIGTAALNFCEGYLAGCRHGRDAEHVDISWAKAVLSAEPASGAVRGDERICQLGSGCARSHEPIAD
jgi:hypothetical protein